MKISRFISHNREISAGLLIMLILVLLTATMSPVRSTQFILAEWDYPDEYGQGIEAVRVYQNISGAWESVGSEFDITSGDSTALEINNTATGIKILVKCWLNNTLVEAVDFEDGKNYLRHNATLTIIGDISGEVIFSLQNFTYTAGTDALDPMFYYQYEGIIPFTPIGGQTYRAMVTYEIQYIIVSDTILTATSGSTDAGTPTGDYTDTHTVNDVFLGGTDPDEISVILWVEFAAEEIGGFNYAAYWNSSTSGYIYIYNHTSSDWVLLDDTPNGDNGPLAWDNDTVKNEDYYNSTSVGFKFVATSLIGSGHIYVDYFQIQVSPGSQWPDISTVDFFLIVSLDEWGMNTALIILGLVMIPTSTIYLAYGAKHDRSSDRLFYGLLIFMLGCGLLIGGVLP